MDNFIKTISKQKTEYLFVVLISLFIIYDVSVPENIASLVDTIFGKIILYILALSLFKFHPVLGAVSLVGAFELIRRSEHKTGTHHLKRYLPTQAKKDQHFSAMNQFPLTLEEEMVAKMTPLVAETPLVAPSYKPVLSSTHNATLL